MTKEQLLPLAKTYFDSDPNRTEIFGTEDKHFFNTEGDAKYYCKADKSYYHFTKIDFEKPNPKPKIERGELLKPLWEFLDESLHDSNFDEMSEEDFDKLFEELKEAKKAKADELALSEKKRKEELFDERKIMIVPYSEFKPRYKLTLNTKQETFDKILADLKAKKGKAEINTK